MNRKITPIIAALLFSNVQCVSNLYCPLKTSSTGFGHSAYLILSLSALSASAESSKGLNDNNGDKISVPAGIFSSSGGPIPGSSPRLTCSPVDGLVGVVPVVSAGSVKSGLSDGLRKSDTAGFAAPVEAVTSRAVTGLVWSYAKPEYPASRLLFAMHYLQHQK